MRLTAIGATAIVAFIGVVLARSGQAPVVQPADESTLREYTGVYRWEPNAFMPLAAVRATDLAFLVSISGAGVTPAETTLDQAQNEMTSRGMKPETIAAIIDVMKPQYDFARTGADWDAYSSARAKLAARLGNPPDSLPGTPDHPSWQFIRRTYFCDPAPTLRQLRVPVLAIFGELDNNILAEKNKAAWEAALKAGGHGDYTLLVLPKANHGQFEAKIGSNAEQPSLQRLVPSYFATVETWLAKRIRGFAGSK